MSSATLTVLSRAGCHLCEALLDELALLRSQLDFDVKVVDIDGDQDLRRRYNADVPVLMHADRVVCQHFLDPERVREALAHG
ncbi:MAG: glutaredoxin family protein [Thiotrichales bacterium]